MITLDLAGWRVSLECQPAVLADAVAARYAPFASTAPPHVQVHVTQDGAPSAGSGQALHHHAWLDSLLALDGDSFTLAGPGLSDCFDLNSGQATLALHSTTPLEDVEFFVRMVYAWLAYHGGGLLIHAAGALAAGRVHLFTGPSGSGKSTVALLSPDTVILNDDLVLLRPQADGWIAYGTPFWNATTVTRAGQTANGPVAGIYRLVQDRDVFLESLSRAAAAAELAANCPVINGDPARLPGLLARCQALAQAVPVQRLHFRKDASFWGLLSSQ